MTKLRAVLRRRWPILLVTVVVGAIAGAVSSQLAPKEVERAYTASQTIVANRNSAVSTLVPQDRLKVTRGDVPRRAAELLDAAGSEESLAGKIQTTFDEESSSITISTTDLDPATATARVDAFVKAFLEITNAKLQVDSRREVAQAEADLAQAKENLAALDAAYPELSRPGANLPNDVGTQTLVAQRRDLLASIAGFEREVRERERELSRTAPYESLGPEAPRLAESGLISVPTSTPVRAAMLAMLGLFLGGVVALVIERVHRRIDTREELASVIDLPIIAEIGYLPEQRRLQGTDGVLQLDGVWAEPYRRIRSAIQFTQVSVAGPGFDGVGLPRIGEPAVTPRVFLITSASPGEGKSTSTCLTAQALAEVGVPTVVVGGDFRKPEVERLLGSETSPSLQDLARLDIDRPTIDGVVHPTRFANLWVAPAGRATREVADLVEAAKAVSIEASRRGATVLIDSSPLQAANDTVDLLPAVDYVILVVRSGRSSEAELTDAIDLLRRMDSRILGVVLIGTHMAGRQQSYYYGYYNPQVSESANEAPATEVDRVG